MKTKINPTYQYLLFLLSLAFFLVLSNGRPLVSPTPNLITEACSQSPKKDFCEKTINSDHTSPRKTLNDITFIAFDQTDKAATNNIQFISQANAVSGTALNDPAQAKAIKLCDKEYERASDAIDNAINALSSGTKGEEIDKSLKDATTAVLTCQESTRGQQGKAMQLDHMNQDLLDLLNNALSVFNVYKKNSN